MITLENELWISDYSQILHVSLTTYGHYQGIYQEHEVNHILKRVQWLHWLESQRKLVKMGFVIQNNISTQLQASSSTLGRELASMRD